MLKRKKSKTKLKQIQIFPRPISRRTKLILAAGILIFISPLLFSLYQTFQLRFITPKIPVSIASTAQRQYAPPIEIKIPKIETDLPIEETTINNGVWDISAKAISHLSISARPEENGPVILYSHNTNNRFGPIRWLSEGDEVIVITGDKKEHKYKVIATTDVEPTQTHIFFSHKGETLYLYTCDGFADLKRFVVTALPEKS